MSDDNGPIFGTDGIRGEAGEGWLGVELVSALGRAIGMVLGRDVAAGDEQRAVLGHDGRRSGPQLEAALARGLFRAGLDVTSAGLITTPGLAPISCSDGVFPTNSFRSTPACSADYIAQHFPQRMRGGPPAHPGTCNPTCSKSVCRRRSHNLQTS